METVASRALRPLTPEYPNAAPCLWYPWTSTMVSSISTSTVPESAMPPSNSVCSARLSRNREATASAWRTCPKVNERRNEPSVEGAYAPVKTLPIPP